MKNTANVGTRNDLSHNGYGCFLERLEPVVVIQQLVRAISASSCLPESSSHPQKFRTPSSRHQFSDSVTTILHHYGLAQHVHSFSLVRFWRLVLRSDSCCAMSDRSLVGSQLHPTSPSRQSHHTVTKSRQECHDTSTLSGCAKGFLRASLTQPCKYRPLYILSERSQPNSSTMFRVWELIGAVHVE